MLRHLTHDDIGQLMVLAREMHSNGVYAAYPLNEERTSHVLRSLIDNENVLTVGYEIDDKLVGALSAEISCDPWVDVTIASDIFFFVTAEYRGTLAGARLLMHYEHWANSHGVDVLRPVVYAGVDNDAASSVLTRMGYAMSGYVHIKEARSCA